MFLEIESTNKRAEIREIEVERTRLTFFLSDFFYLTFESETEMQSFVSKLLNNCEGNYSDSDSYVDLAGILNHYPGDSSDFLDILGGLRKIQIKSYYFIIEEDHLEVNFISSYGDITFLLYKPFLNKIKFNLTSNLKGV